MRTKKKFITLSELSKEGRNQMCEWLLSGMPFETVQKLAEKEFCVRMGEDESMESFWKNYCGPMLLEQRKRASLMANEIAAEAEESDVPFEHATLAALKQRSFELMLTPKLDPKMFRQVVSFIMKARDQELSRQRLRLLEKRIDQANEVEDAVKDESLSVDERERKLKEIFGIA